MFGVGSVILLFWDVFNTHRLLFWEDLGGSQKDL